MEYIDLWMYKLLHKQRCISLQVCSDRNGPKQFLQKGLTVRRTAKEVLEEDSVFVRWCSLTSR